MGGLMFPNFKLYYKDTIKKNIDLNKILYDYTVEVTNRFKGLDLTECLKNCGWGL